MYAVKWKITDPVVPKGNVMDLHSQYVDLIFNLHHIRIEYNIFLWKYGHLDWKKNNIFTWHAEQSGGHGEDAHKAGGQEQASGTQVLSTK